MAFNLTSEEDLGGSNETLLSELGRNLTEGVNEAAKDSDQKPREGVFQSSIIIPLYVIIFLLSIIGNSLVLATLGQKKRMKTVTNVYLVNLAVSDLLLGVFCMPFTLIGQVLRNFIFGSVMCMVIPYFQAVSVSVGVWTLVAISLERYFAICRPLESRRWQTQFHAYKMIGFVWVSSLMWTSPILVVSRLKALKMGRHKCREAWPNTTSERAYNIFLDIVLLLVPLGIMSLAYSLIVSKLWKGLQNEIKLSRSDQCESMATMEGVFLNKSFRRAGGDPGPSSSDDAATPTRKSTVKIWLKKVGLSGRDEKDSASSSEITLPVLTSSPRSNEEHPEETALRTAAATQYKFTRHAIRSNYMDKSIEAKKKVIRMLFVVVAEFFICWAPLHILNTWYLFAPEDIYKYIGANGISLIQLLAYISSCCNPITYCFMNKKFRQAFFSVFTCCRSCAATCGETNILQRPKSVPVPTTSEMSGNDSTTGLGRVATQNRSEIETLEAEDRV